VQQQQQQFGFCVFLLCALVANLGFANAKDEWVLLSRHEVNLSKDKAVIDLSKLKDNFRRLRVIGRRGKITVSKMTISFSGGGQKHQEKRFILSAGERTKVIELSKNGRRLEKFEIFYRAQPKSKLKTVIEIWGVKGVEPNGRVATGWCWDARLQRHAPCKIATQKPSSSSEYIPKRKSLRSRGMRRLRRQFASKSVSWNVCESKNICTPVRIFFGTDREKRQGKTRVIFTADRAGKLQLGRAIVTVPKAADRKRGEIPRPTWWERVVLRVPLAGDPAKHFTILKDGFKLFANADDFIVEVREHIKDAGDYKDHAFVFVHGYNVKFDAALYRAAQIAYDLGYDVRGQHIPFGSAFLYSWPSGGETFDYASDLESARLTVEHLKAFIDLVASRSGAKQIHLIAHSMGNVPLMNALAEFAQEPKHAGAKINQVVLAAPDMDLKEFEKLARAITPVAKSVTLYASSKDVAMKASRKVHRDKPRAGDVGDTGPLIVDQVYSIDISALSTEIFAVGHSEYADKKELISDMNRLFVKQEQPPHKRNNNFQRKFRGKTEYWKYAQ
jgi:esterase/lipase superfamily enzyme